MPEKVTRRTAVAGLAAGAVAGIGAASPASAQAPAIQTITPDLIAAARKEGRLAWYTSVDLPVAQRVARAFEAKYAGVTVRVERTGGERIYQRIGQETASKIAACDVVHSSDAAHFIIWKRQGLLAPCLSEDVARHFPTDHKDPEGLFASWRIWLCVIGYNTSLVPQAEAPKSFKDLLDPKWAGKMVKAHPGYSGTIMTATFQMARDLGWGYFEQLAKQRIMQVQSASDPPKKLALGERHVMVDGTDYVAILLKEKGDPIEIVYPTEGTPLIVGPSAVMKNAPNPNAARLFHLWSFTEEAQRLNVEVGGLRSAHALVAEPKGRVPLKDIKVMKDDPAGIERTADEIKTRYSALFKV